MERLEDVIYYVSGSKGSHRRTRYKSLHCRDSPWMIKGFALDTVLHSIDSRRTSKEKRSAWSLKIFHLEKITVPSVRYSVSVPVMSIFF